MFGELGEWIDSCSYIARLAYDICCPAGFVVGQRSQGYNVDTLLTPLHAASTTEAYVN